MQPSELISLFPNQSILVLGDVFLDEFLSGDCSRLSPEAPVPVLRIDAEKTRRVLGGAANTAANIASLSGKAILVGIVGEDFHSKQFGEIVKSLGINFIPIQDGRPTMRKTRLVGQGQQLLRLDYEETREISPTTEQEILAAFRKELPNVGLIILSDYAKGFFNHSLCQTIIDEAHAAGKEVLIDPRPQHAAYYLNADYITPNWRESQGLLGQIECDPTEALILENGNVLRTKLNTHVLLTLGARGMSFFNRDTGAHFSLPTQALEVFDVSGAGDTVVATLALSRAAGFDLESAVRLANSAAGIVVGKLGTATVSPEELLSQNESDENSFTRDTVAGRLLLREQLAPLANRLRAQGKKIVTLNGSFDVLHSGHIHILETARNQGDVLIVGLNSDASVRLNKGSSRPIISEGERAGMLLALRAVDFVHLFDEPNPIPFLSEIKPAIHVNGSEYGEDCIEAPLVQKNGGRIFIVEKIPGLSTSALLTKIRTTE